MSESGNKPWRPGSEAVTPEEFEYAVEGARVMVHFWAPWNPYDKQFDANLQQLRGTWGKRFSFYAVNTDETAFSEIVEKFSVGALPALLCFSNGKVQGRFVGVETVEKLEAFLKEMAESGGRR